MHFASHTPASGNFRSFCSHHVVLDGEYKHMAAKKKVAEVFRGTDGPREFYVLFGRDRRTDNQMKRGKRSFQAVVKEALKPTGKLEKAYVLMGDRDIMLVVSFDTGVGPSAVVAASRGLREKIGFEFSSFPTVTLKDAGLDTGFTNININISPGQ